MPYFQISEDALYLYVEEFKALLQRNTTYPPLHAARNVSQREGFFRHDTLGGRIIVQAGRGYLFRERVETGPSPRAP